MESNLIIANERALAHAANPTPAEILMTAKLEYCHIKYKFKYVVINGSSFYIVDFFLPEFKIIIQLDGPSHYSEEIQKKDHYRDVFLQSQGYKVLHLKNHIVDFFKTSSLKDLEFMPIEKVEYMSNSLSKEAKKAKAFFDNIERTKYGKK